jgi:hypothetical protein
LHPAITDEYADMWIVENNAMIKILAL